MQDRALTPSQPAARAADAPIAAGSRVVRLPGERERGLGGKAANLRRLALLGLPVPAACVVTTEAFTAHRAGLAPELAPEALRAATLRAPLDAALREELGAALAWLGDVPLAVRSSAVGEDGAARSFAGQHDTVLDVRGLDAAVDAVRRCWASAWSERAVEYRGAAGGADEREAPAMAVIVQRLVRARAAGVLFTVDPATGADTLLVEAVAGLGESLVAGRAAPDRFAIARDTLAVTTLARDAGAPLGDATLRELARMALAVERAFGAPQDIEWALDEDGAVVLLQTRPVTSTRARDAASSSSSSSPGPRYVWANTNAGELLPELATPLTVDVCDRFVRELIAPLLEDGGFDIANGPIIGLVAGRAYFCMNTFAAMMSAVPGMRGRSPAELFGGDGAEIARALAETAASAGDRPLVRWRATRAAVGVPRLLALVARQHRVAPARALAAVAARTRELAAADLAALDDAGLLAHLDAVLDLRRADWRACIGALIVGVASLGALSALCRRWLGDADGARANTLLSGLGGVASAQSGLELWAVVDAARAPDVAPWVRAGEPFDALRARLCAPDAAPGGREFLARWDAWVGRHGHHARGELDVAVPRSHEEPDALLATVRALLDAPASADPVAQHARRAAERAALEARTAQALGLVRRAVFRAVLARAQRAVVWRENTKSEAIRRVALARATLLALGARLVAAGRLERDDDVFYLTLDELRAASADRARADAPRGDTLGALVTRRRRDRARFAALEPPAVVVGEFDPSTAPAPAPRAGARLLRGIAVSPGVVEGPARVILAANRDERVRAGEILVAPFTDPGWAPHFLAAAGLVVDLGGVLSHGSIVAREMGIPAVVNVRDGTRAIRTGQRVRVDAIRGEVELLD